MRTENIRQAGKDKLQDYGREGLAPVMELFSRYGKEIVHHLRHVGDGLEKGCQSLRDSEQFKEEGACEEREMVASWFEEGARWVKQLEAQLERSDSEDILDFIEQQGRQHPAALFATSLIAGSAFGVVGNQVYHERPSARTSEADIDSQNYGRNI